MCNGVEPLLSRELTFEPDAGRSRAIRREIASLTRFGPVPVYSTLAGGPPVGYWVSTTISTVLYVLQILTVGEEDEDDLLLMSDQLAGESLSFFDTEVIATDISNTFPNIVVL